MTKRPRGYAICWDPLFRVQRAQTYLILLADSHLVAVAANNNLFMLHLFMLIQTLLVQLVAQVFLHNGSLDTLSFLDVALISPKNRIHLWTQAHELGYGWPQHSSLNLPRTFLFSMLWFGWSLG